MRGLAREPDLAEAHPVLLHVLLSSGRARLCARSRAGHHTTLHHLPACSGREERKGGGRERPPQNGDLWSPATSAKDSQRPLGFMSSGLELTGCLNKSLLIPGTVYPAQIGKEKGLAGRQGQNGSIKYILHRVRGICNLQQYYVKQTLEAARKVGDGAEELPFEKQRCVLLWCMEKGHG